MTIHDEIDWSRFTYGLNETSWGVSTKTVHIMEPSPYKLDRGTVASICWHHLENLPEVPHTPELWDGGPWGFGPKLCSLCWGVAVNIEMNARRSSES